MQNLISLDALQTVFLRHTLMEWIYVVGIWALVALILVAVRRYAAWRLGAMAERTTSKIIALLATALARTTPAFLVIVALYLATSLMAIEPPVARWIHTITVISFLIQSVRWGNALITLSIAQYRADRIETDAAAVTTMNAMGFIGRLILFSVLLLVGLENLGVQITGLIAGLGVGGIAVALAVQNILGDLFASLSIVLDKPFVIGDFLIVDGYLGTVEYIGLKTTRIRSLSGEQIVFSNSDLLNSRVRNFKRMFERRVVFQVGVLYSTPVDHLEAISVWLREIVESQDQVRFDRAHFQGFDDSSLRFEIVYHVLGPDFNLYMDIQEKINLGIVRRFRENGIQFAFPTRTLHVEPANGRTDFVGAMKEK
jgi:small-conductance mechanosensitive channel